MRKIAQGGLFLLIFFLASSAGNKEEGPDREMLRLMELLREWDTIQNLDLMRELDGLERTGNPSEGRDRQKSPGGSIKDRQK